MSPADAEHYEGGLVLSLAYVIAGVEGGAFSALSYRRRKHCLDIASKQAAMLFNAGKVIHGAR